MAKSSMLIYGDTGDGKTGLAESWARFINKVTGKPIRYYTAEPGGVDTLDPALIESGILEIVRINESANFSEALEWASEGYSWSDAGKLLEPQHDKYGGYIHEGGTSYGELIMEELRMKAAKNEIGGAEKAPQTYKSGSLLIAGSNQTHYGIGQSRVARAIRVSQRCPVHILWTMQEVKAGDDEMISGFRELYGPKTVGSAQTPYIPGWFGKTLHVDIVREGKENKPVRRVFFKTHFYEGMKTPYIANPRVHMSIHDALPESAIVTNDGLTLERFYDSISSLIAARAASK